MRTADDPWARFPALAADSAPPGPTLARPDGDGVTA